MSAIVEKAAEVLAAHARCYPTFWGGRWNFVCGVDIEATDVRGASGAHRAHVAQALADAELLIAAFPDGTTGTLTGDLLTDMAAYAGRLRDRAEAAETKLALVAETLAWDRPYDTRIDAAHEVIFGEVSP